MSPRQALEARPQEASPMLQNQDVTTAAVILNNVLGTPLPRSIMNLATPKDQPIPMGHDCTRCAATATCSLLNKATENEGNNPIMDRINAISLIKNEDPEFIQRATPENRETLIRAKMMEIKEQRLNVVVEKPQIEVVAQEVKVKAIPIQETPKNEKSEPETVIEDIVPVIPIEKITSPKKEKRKRQEKVDPFVLPKEVFEVPVERPQKSTEFHPVNIPIVIKTEKPIEKKPAIPKKTQEVQIKIAVPIIKIEAKTMEIKPKYIKPIKPVIIPMQKPHITHNQKNTLMEKGSIILDKTKRKVNVITTNVDKKMNRSLMEMFFHKKSKLPPLIMIPNVFVDKDQPPRSKKEGAIFNINISKGEIFRYSPRLEIDNPTLRSFSLISLAVVDLNRLYKLHNRSKRLNNMENKRRKKNRRKINEEVSKSVPRNINDLLKNYVQEYVHKNKDNFIESSSNQKIKSEGIEKKRTKILVEHIQKIVSEKKKFPFALIILSFSNQELLGHNQKSNDKKLFDLEDNETKYEVLPINQNEFLNIVILSTLMMDVMSLLSGTKSVDSLFAPEEIQKRIKNQTKNMSIIIWYMVKVLQSINLLNIYFLRK